MKNNKTTCTIILALSLLYATLSSVQAQEKSTPGTVAELKIAIEKVLEQTKTPAVGLALINRDSSVWISALGKANIEHNIKATENTMFRIGSTSKMFVSLAILKLQEEGRVSLRDKVKDLVPEIEFKNPWSKTSPIVVEHLLEHTTGWDDMHLVDYALNDPNLTLKEGLDFHPDSRTSRWIPGTRMSYCNSGPPVAAYIIEKITGQTFEDYIQEHFFEPMGMEHMTYFASDQYKLLGATLYKDGEPQKYWNISVRPSGAINASPKDMANMLQFFINRGRVDSLQLISEASLKRMETPTSSTGAKAGLEYGYGLSNYSSSHKRFVYRSHNGGVNGGLTDFSYLPEHKLGYAVMINSGNTNALSRITKLIREFQTKYIRDGEIGRSKIEPNQEHTIAGYYVPINPRIQMNYYLERILNVKHIWTKDNYTIIKGLFGGWPQIHISVEDRKYLVTETGKVSMVQVIDPLAGEVVHYGSQVLKRVSPLLVFGQLILGVAWIVGSITSLFLGIFWSIRYLKRKIPVSPALSVLVWPFVASLVLLISIILNFLSFSNPIELLGTMNFLSVSIMLLGICFALASAWSVVNVINKRKAIIDKYIYWHSVIVSGLHVTVTSYLLWYGLIGLQTWSY